MSHIWPGLSGILLPAQPSTRQMSSDKNDHPNMPNAPKAIRILRCSFMRLTARLRQVEPRMYKCKQKRDLGFACTENVRTLRHHFTLSFISVPLKL